MLDVRRREVVGTSQLPIEGYGAEGVEWRRKERVGLDVEDGRWSMMGTEPERMRTASGGRLAAMRWLPSTLSGSQTWRERRESYR
jgi:hypothetical protein